MRKKNNKGFGFTIICNRCDSIVELDKKTKSFSTNESAIFILPATGFSYRMLKITCDCGNEVKLMEETNVDTIPK